MNKHLRIPTSDELYTLLQGMQDLLLMERGPFRVYLGSAEQIGPVLYTIGQQRERTFKAVGEGTGKELDIDKYDKHYLNLFIYDHEMRVLVGGYRIGPGKELYERKGVKGFYIRSLFKIKKPFHAKLKQSLELGRSYVVPEYQKSPLPLFLLWQGLLKVVQSMPEVNYIIGPVSISKEYPERSRSAVVSFVMRHLWDHENAQYIKARKPYHIQLDWKDIDSIMRLGKDFTDLENFLKTIQPDHVKLPVLLKQYAKQNAHFLGFNLDPEFNDALDGLMMLDIKDLPQETIEMLLAKRLQDPAPGFQEVQGREPNKNPSDTNS